MGQVYFRFYFQEKENRFPGTAGAAWRPVLETGGNHPDLADKVLCSVCKYIQLKK